MGSIFAYLQARGWSTGTSAGVRTSFAKDFVLFEVSVALTLEGLQNWQPILSLLYQQLENCKSADNEKLMELWEELRAVRALEFQYLEKTNAYETAPMLAERMLDFPLEKVLSAGYLLGNLDVSQLRDFLSMLTSSRSVVFLRSQSFENLPADDVTYVDFLLDACKDSVNPPEVSESIEPSPIRSYSFASLSEYKHTSVSIEEDVNSKTKIEPYYGVSYELEKVPPQQLTLTLPAEAQSALTLPQPNRFLCLELLSPKYLKLDNGAQDHAEVVVKETDIHTGVEKSPIRSPPPLQYSPAGVTAEAGDTSGIWFSRDEVFKQPRTIFYCLFHSPNCGELPFLYSVSKQ